MASHADGRCGDKAMGDEALIREIIRSALLEDVGSGDITSLATIPDGTGATADFIAKAPGVVAGLSVAEMVFEEVDPSIAVSWSAHDGDLVHPGQHFGSVRGPARSLLTAERLALNLLQRMSGIATQTRAMVDAVGALPSTILDTRKTAPGLRPVDRMAVRIGGGRNHRYNLSDMVLIKDNHISAAGGVVPAIRAAWSHLAARGLTGAVQIEVEARTLDEVREVLSVIEGNAGGSGIAAGAGIVIDRVLLDNMVRVTRGDLDAEGEPETVVDTSLLREAVALISRRVATEASGNVTVDTVAAIAEAGVDFISSGSLTHSVTALDISMKIQIQ